MEKSLNISGVYNFPEIYDLLFYPYESQIKWLERMLATYFPDGVKGLLEPACGSGYWLERVSFEYAAGIDINPNMVQWCKAKFKHNENIVIKLGDMCTLPRELFEKFDLSINVESTIGHLQSYCEVSQHLKSVRHALKSGGFYFLGCPLVNMLSSDEGGVGFYETGYKFKNAFQANLKMWGETRNVEAVHRTKYLVEIHGVSSYPEMISGSFDINQYDCTRITQLISDSGFKLQSAAYMDISGIPESTNLYNLGLTSLVLKAI